MVIKISNDTSTLNGALTELGETMATNITSKGVTATASDGLTTLAGKILNIAEEDIITITAKPYLQGTDKTDITVHLTNGIGTPLTGKTVTITDGTNTYTGKTDKNGLFKIYNITVTTTTTYTATYGTITDTIVITPCKFVDYAVTTNKSTEWYVRTADTTLTVTTDDEATKLSNSSTSTSVYYFPNPDHSTSTTPQVTITNFAIECDVISTTFTSGSEIAFLLQGVGSNFNLKSYTAPYHLKVIKNGTSVQQWVDDTLIRTTSISSRTSYYMGFQLYKESEITFKNYHIYTL